MSIAKGDIVNVHFERANSILGATVEYRPSPDEDSFGLILADGRSVYVKNYAVIEQAKKETKL